MIDTARPFLKNQEASVTNSGKQPYKQAAHLSHYTNKTTRCLGYFACVIWLLLSAACKPAPSGSGDNRFRVNLGTEPPSLDWSLATDHVSFNVIANLMGLKVQ